MLVAFPKFQSLFYWKYLWDFKIKGVFSSNVPVSILVLLEVSLRQFRLHLLPLCLWVSILVLLEVSLRPRRHEMCLWILFMFQSLFYWKYLWDVTSKACRDIGILVSILVLLEVSLRLSLHPPPLTWSIWFQSLFYWKYLWDHKDLQTNLQLIPCFNPCFIGSISETSQHHGRTTGNQVSILVLLEVSLRRCYQLETENWLCVSILVLLEVSLRPPIRN